MAGIEDHVESSVNSLKDDRLRALGTGLLNMIDFLATLDDLTPAGDVRMGDLKAEKAHAFDLLDQLVGMNYHALASELVFIPEQLLVERLRSFGQTWAAIGDHVHLNTASLYRRHNKPGEPASADGDTSSGSDEA